MAPKRQAPKELIEVRIVESWIKLVQACNGKANALLTTRIINGQPTDSQFTDEHFRPDINSSMAPAIELVEKKSISGSGALDK